MRLAVVKSAFAQRQAHVRQPIERELDLALDDGAVGDASDRRNAAHDLGRLALGLEAGDRERTLRHPIDVAVGAQEGGHEQGAALEVLGVAERGDGDIHARALGGEGRQVACHHHGRDVAGADGGAADVDAHALEHRLQRLLGEGDVVERVAGAVEADDEAVADELVLPHALDVGEVLDARCRACRRDRERQRRQRGAGHPNNPHPTNAWHPLLPKAPKEAPQIGRTCTTLP